MITFATLTGIYRNSTEIKEQASRKLSSLSNPSPKWAETQRIKREDIWKDVINHKKLELLSCLVNGMSKKISKMVSVVF